MGSGSWESAQHANRPFAPKLEGWKAIADYFCRTVRTVQRWERHERLPVQRLQHQSLSTVFAYRTELDRWRTERLPSIDVAPETHRELIAGDTPEALCAMSREHWAQRTIGGLEESIDLARAALRRCPTFAPAHAMLAKAFATRASYVHAPPSPDLGEACAAAQRALEFDPCSAEAHQALGLVHLFEYRWNTSRSHFDEALKRNPGDATTYQWFSLWHLAQDHDCEAHELSAHAEQIEPTSLVLAAHTAWVLHLTGCYDDAIRESRALIRRNRHFWRGYFNLALSLAAAGRPADALNALEIATALNNQRSLRAINIHMKALAGDPDGARVDLMELMRSTDHQSAYWQAFAAASLRDDALTFQQLNVAIRQHEWFVLLLKHDPAFHALRELAPFRAVTRQIGLP